MIFLNGEKVETIERLEELMIGLSDYQKECLRNDFNGIPNTQVIGTPQTVTPRQIRVALIMSGISLELIENTINSLPEPQKSITKVTWEYSVEFQRNNPMILAMAPLLGLNNEQIDQLFILASTL
jgi:hypothetical protein